MDANDKEKLATIFNTRVQRMNSIELANQLVDHLKPIINDEDHNYLLYLMINKLREIAAKEALTSIINRSEQLRDHSYNTFS